MNKKRMLGVILSLAGASITVYSPKVTGGVIGILEGVLVKVAGIIIFLAGAALFASADSQEEYRSRESKLQHSLGDRYGHLSEKEKHAYNKSLRRSEERMGEEKNYHGGIERMMVRTPSFEKSIRKHDLNAIEKAINNIGTGKGHEEVLKHGDHAGLRSIHVDKGKRIIFKKKDERNYILLEYDTKHYK